MRSPWFSILYAGMRKKCVESFRCAFRLFESTYKGKRKTRPPDHSRVLPAEERAGGMGQTRAGALGEWAIMSPIGFRRKIRG